MSKFAVFLRGVNVGGVKVLMKDLKQLLQEAGFTEVKTLLASGNVVLESSESDPQLIQARCDELLSKHYQRSIPTLVFDAQQIKELAGPFALPIPEPVKEHHGYLTLCQSTTDAKELGEAIDALESSQDFLIIGRALLWVAAKGTSTTDPLAKLIQTQAKQRTLTTRNHNTLVKIAKIIG